MSVNDIVEYKNKYGKLKMCLVSDPEPVRGINSTKVPDNCFISMEHAEQIALITENKQIQIAMTPDLKKVYVVVHDSASIASIAKVDSISFAGNNAAKEINRLARNSEFI